MSRFGLTIASIWLQICLLGAAAQAAVEVGPDFTSSDLIGEISYFLDEDRDLSVEDVLGPQINFQQVEDPFPRFGYTRARIWLRFEVQNLEDRERETRLWVRENFFQYFAVFVVHEDGRVDTVEDLTPQSTFSERPVPYAQLVAPLNLQPNETATILVRYASGGSSEAKMTLESRESFAGQAANNTAKKFVFYGMMTIMVVAALIAFAILRLSVFPAYAAYAGSILMYIVHSDGTGFQYLWPNAPWFNTNASLVWGSSFIICGAIYTRLFLETAKYHPVMNKVLYAVIAAAIGLDIYALIDTQMAKKLMVLFALISIIACISAGVVAAIERFKMVRFFMFAWIGGAFAALIMTLQHWIGLDISQEAQLDFMRLVMVLDAGLMGLAIADRYLQERTLQQEVLQENLAQTRENLDLSRRLQALENKYAEAEEAARDRDISSQNALHDLRQPLNALRLTVNSLTGDDRLSDGWATAETTLDYLENLLAEHVSANNEAPASSEMIGLPELLNTIHAMFIEDAQQKGTNLLLDPDIPDVEVPALQVMRILSNLVANAIKYSTEGAIRLHASRRGKTIAVEVRDDGPGLTQEEFQLAIRRKVRLERHSDGIEGQGFGLAIAHDLAESLNFDLQLLAPEGKGAAISLNMPVPVSQSG
ncbi:sensor histidine kinase [Hoeflea prorocentri]|uniref:histidine kinase n=1 Tax=Hoeflea prorocentri TaxID=1922333 RepID=A0A9X3UI31_9HYPH|nr:sensor histidine kinase [Hoeflea prorocentri]MCY6381798.1 sensor histidine kinase [Hoeflea prorocentri]MDA5399598.1 sensor histidine kinase [Hoeflea prorocentri]